MFQKTNGKITFNVLNAICFYIDQLNLFLDFYKIIYFFNMFCYILFFFFCYKEYKERIFFEKWFSGSFLNNITLDFHILVFKIHYKKFKEQTIFKKICIIAFFFFN